MLTMMMRPGRALGAALALGTLAAVGALAPAQSQEPRPRTRVERDDCRCVDRDGNPIENCTCFRSPDMSGMLARVGPLRGSRARLGITLTEDLGADEASKGARIQSVLEDGPADEAGLRKGDVITALDGKSLLRPLDSEAEKDFDLDGSVAVQRLMALVRDVEPGQDVRVDYLRDGASQSTTVKAEKLDDWGVSVVVPRWRGDPDEMAEAMEDMRGRLGEYRFRVRPPDAPDAPDAPRGTFQFRSPSVLYRGLSGECPAEEGEGRTVAWFSSTCVAGVALEELNPKLGAYFGTSDGVLVTDVGDDSPLGLEPGDVILEIGGRKATDADRVRRILGSYGDDEPINLRIMRQKREMSVQGKLGR